MFTMKFARHLYLSEGMEKKKRKVMHRLRRGKLQVPVYLIALCDYGQERLEILSSAELLQKGYPPGLLIAGIAGDYDDALELVRRSPRRPLTPYGTDCADTYTTGNRRVICFTFYY